MIVTGGEVVTTGEYTSIGRVTEFNACANIGYVLRRKNQQLKYLKNWGECALKKHLLHYYNLSLLNIYFVNGR